MGKQIGKNERKASKSRFGTFFFGTFIGFLLCIALIAGVGCFVYFKVSPKWINDTFKTNIDLGSEEANKKTLKDFVTSAVSLVSNADTYTLNDLKNDFGIDIGAELMGINIEDLKDVGLTDLPDAVENKFQNISANDLKSLMNIQSTDSLGKLLNKELTFYYASPNKLYKDEAKNTEVNFDYEIADGQVEINNATKSIVDNKVSFQLWDLPITAALSDFMAQMGDKITIGELNSIFGVQLPEYFSTVDQDATINELEDEIEKIYVGTFLNYTVDATDKDNISVKNGTQDVTGFMYIIASKQIGELKDLKTVIQDTQIAEFLDYKIVGNKVYQKDGTTEVTGIMAKIAKFTVSGLNDGIKGLKLNDIFSTAELSSGALSLISADTELTNIAGALKEAFEKKTVEDFNKAKVITVPTEYENNKEKWIGVPTDEEGVYEYKQVKNLLLQDIIDVFFDSLDWSKLPASKPTEGV